MSAERTDAAIVARLIERTRLLIALSDEIPVETKLNTQALLKMFEAAVEADEDLRDEALIGGYYERIYADLREYADLEALLSAMKVFLPFL
jgi:hypothetical protein